LCGAQGSAIKTFRQRSSVFPNGSNVKIAQLRSWNQCLRS
jgi:hypothetical protein